MAYTDTELEDAIKNNSELKELDRQIDEQKRLMKVEINNLKKTYSEVIKSIEDAKVKVIEKINYDLNHTYSIDEDGNQYRQATKKMMHYAWSINGALPNRIGYTGKHVKRLYDFANEAGRPTDDFNTVSKYISEYAPIAKAIWDDNKQYMRDRYRESEEYKSQKRQQELEEEVERLREENRGIYGTFCGTGYYDDGDADLHIGPP